MSGKLALPLYCHVYHSGDIVSCYSASALQSRFKQLERVHKRVRSVIESLRNMPESGRIKQLKGLSLSEKKKKKEREIICSWEHWQKAQKCDNDFMFYFVVFLVLFHLFCFVFFQSSRQNYVCMSWILREYRLHVEDCYHVRVRDINCWYNLSRVIIIFSINKICLIKDMCLSNDMVCWDEEFSISIMLIPGNWVLLLVAEGLTLETNVCCTRFQHSYEKQ